MAYTEKRSDGNIIGEYHSNRFVSRLVFFGILLVIPLISPGMTMAYSSIALPQLQLNLDEASWFGSIISISRPFGCLFTGFVVDKYGRRASMVASIIPGIIGWFLLVDRNASLTQLYVGRLCTGFTLGAGNLPYTIYLAECITVNNIQIRSSVNVWPCISMTTGFFLVYSLGAMLPYNTVAFISGCWSTLSLLLIMIFVPESPVWLYGRNRVGDAEVAQLRLGIKQPILQNRIVPIISANFESHGHQYSKSLIHYFAKIRNREVYKPLAITITFLFFAEFSGLNGLVSYMVDVINVYPLKLDPYVLAVGCGALQVFGCVLSTLIVPYSGVRRLSGASFLSVAIGFLVLAFSILFESSSAYANFFNYLHFVCIWVITLVGMVGVQVIPYSILGEIFPVGAKGYAGLSLFACAIFNFTILKVFPYMLVQHKNVMFFLFSVISACGAVFVGVFLPETVGKTMDEISNGFERDENYEYDMSHEQSRGNRNSILYEKLSCV